MASLPLRNLCCTFLMIFVFSHVHIPSPTVLAFPDEYLPKRLDTQSQDSITMDMSDDPEPYSHVNNTKPRSYLPSVFQCATLCYLEPPTHEMIQCKRSTPHLIELEAELKPEKSIFCQEFRNRREIVIGQKESVRGISPGALEHLISPTDDWFSSAGQLAIHLNLNMVRLDPKVFIGLETLLTEVRLLNTVQMHPDTFIDLRHLRVFEIDSGLTPVPLIQDGQSESNTVTNPETPMFLRIRPADKSVPISFNLEAECHQCVPDTNDTTTKSDIVVVVVFTKPRRVRQQQQQQTSTSYQTQFSMLFPQMCPKRHRALGCPRDGNLSDYLIGSSDTDTAPMNEVSLTDLRDARIIVTEAKTPSLLILLSIWCTVLTLVIVIIVCIVYFCTKRFTGNKSVPKWFPTSCFTLHSSSPEDLSSSSTNSGFFNQQQPGQHQTEKVELFPVGMIESHTSWNSLRAKPLRSTSSPSLKDKSIRTLRNSRMSIDRARHMGPARRSIGSQTDFTVMDSDTAVYSSLRRPSSFARDYFGQEPPVRTSSQYALSRMRYSNRFDNALPANVERSVRNVMQTRYPTESNHMLSHSNTTTTNCPDTDEQLDLDSNDLGLEAFINMMDSEIPGKPYGLPPVYPAAKPGNHSPAPWRKQNGLSLDV